MIRKVLAALGIVTAAGAPAIYAATRPATMEVASPAPSYPSGADRGHDDLPTQGEEIEPCCCPLNDDKK